MDYTAEQLAVIHHPGGHARVDAVPGSGKTHTMVGRVAHLVRDRGVSPRRIMVLMFNKAAQLQFRERLRAALGPVGDEVTVRTYHSLGFKLTELFVARGLLPDYRLATQEWEFNNLAKAALTFTFRNEFGAKAYPSDDIQNEFLLYVDLVKADRVPAWQRFEQLGFALEHSYLIEAFDRFEEARREQRVRFFADLLHEPVQLLHSRPETRELVTNKLDFVIADEYQDTNAIQEDLLRYIAGERAEVMVVGDVDQCIYEWRGARPELLVSGFAAHFPDPTAYTLSHTFRYGHAVSLLANSVIGHNQLRVDKLCLSEPTTPHTRVEPIRVGGKSHPAGALIDQWREEGRLLADAVVLVRKFSQSIPVELALLEHGIPYRVEGRESLFHTREINALVTVLKLASGRLYNGDPERVSRDIEDFLSVPHLGLKQKRLAAAARRMAGDQARAANLLDALKAESASPYQQGKIAERAALWQELQSGAWRDLAPAEVIIRHMARTDIRTQFRRLAANAEDAEEKLLACTGFTEFCRAQELGLDPLIDWIEQLRAADTASLPEDHLTVTTIHRAKGLEWPLVLLAGLSDAQFPGGDISPEGEEAERRLFYVGITRAKERLVLALPADPQLDRCIREGRRDVPPDRMATRFVYEANLRVASAVAGHLAGREEGRLNAAVPGPANAYLTALGSGLRVERVVPPKNAAKTASPGKKPAFRPGMAVRHPKFGRGTVRAYHPAEGRVEVSFPRAGTKMLAIEYAGLELA